MVGLDLFNVTPTQLAENLLHGAMSDAYSAIRLAGTDKQYNEAMARAVGGLCEGLMQLTKGLRATYAEAHKVNQRLVHLERSLGKGNR